MFQIKEVVIIAAGLAALTGGADAASAAVVRYEVAGTFEDGSKLSGAFEVNDDPTQNPSDPFKANIYRNIAINVGTLATFTSFSTYGFAWGQGYNFILGFDNTDNGDGQSIQFYFSANFVNQYILTGLRSEELYRFTSYYYRDTSAGPVFLRNGTIKIATLAVPEPATWAMMICGFGMVGGAIRRRRVNARVSFA